MRLLLLLLLLALVGVARADDADKPFCSTYRLDETTAAALPRLAGVSRSIVDRFCAAELPSKRQISLALVEFLRESVDDFDALGIDKSILPLRQAVAMIARDVESGDEIDNMAPPNGQLVLRFSSGAVQVTNAAACDEKVAKASEEKRIGAKTCLELIGAYQAIYSHAQYLVQRQAAQAVKQYLNLVQKDWDDFFVQSRSQTSLELLLNSAIWRKGKRPGMFLEPPDRQFIVLHPSFILEYLRNAAEGSRQKDGLMVEWAGANWWRRDKWYQLSGASLVSVYSDRAGVSDWGTGVALHFGNKLTVGGVRHAGANGVFISLDVLELFKDKRSLIDGYIGGLKNAAGQ